MPKVNVYLPDRLAEAVRQYDVPLSQTCQRALELEVASRMPLLELTPRARDVLGLARDRAVGFGHNYVGVEHLLLAIIEEERSLAAQVIGKVTSLTVLRDRLLEVVTAGTITSNRVVDHEGRVFGYLVADRSGGARMIRPDGTKISHDQEGTRRFTDEHGNEVLPLNADEAPYLIDLDADGNPRVRIDKHGRRLPPPD